MNSFKAGDELFVRATVEEIWDEDGDPRIEVFGASIVCTKEELAQALEGYTVISLDELAALARVGSMYLTALDEDPENEWLTLPEALAVTGVRLAVENAEQLLSPTPTGTES